MLNNHPASLRTKLQGKSMFRHLGSHTSVPSDATLVANRTEWIKEVLFACQVYSLMF